MGLDLHLCAIRAEDLMQRNFDNVIELAYARKNWALFNFFRLGNREIFNIGEETYLVDEDTWDKFAQQIEPIYNDYDRTLSTSYKMIYKMDYFTEFSKHKWKVLSKYAHWAQRFSDHYGDTTLGIDFDASGYLNFAGADREVRRYLADNDYEVIILASY